MKRTPVDARISSALVGIATAVIVGLNVVDVLDAARTGDTTSQWAAQAQSTVDAAIDAFVGLAAR